MKKTTNPHGDPMTTPAALAYWWMVEYDPNKTKYVMHRKMSNACYELFSFVSKSMGYDPRTNQQWVHVTLPKDVSIAGALVELGYFLPYINPSEGYKHIGIFEHTGSEYGMYELREYSETDIRLFIQVYGRERELQRFATWRAALEYVQANHWYASEEYDDITAAP